MSNTAPEGTQTKITGFVIIISSIAAVAGILFGFDTGVISGAILFIKDEFYLSPLMNGVIVSAVLIGALLGSAISGWFADYFGRRRLLVVTALLFLIGTFGSAFANSIATLFTSRLIVGFAIGVASFTAPLYISEVSPSNFRGALVTLNQLAITIGIMLAYLVDNHYAYTGAWRWMLGMGAIPAMVLLIGMIFLPNSPRWLFHKGKLEKSKTTLSKIRKSNDVHNELDEIQRSLKSRASWGLLLQKWLRPALVIAVGMGFFQQFTGINTVIYYAPTIFEMSGFKNAQIAILATTGIGIINVLFTIIAIPLIDKIGRRVLLFIGISGMTLSLIVLSLGFHLTITTGIVKWTTFFSLIVYIASFAISLGPIMWLLFSEIFPLEVRGLGASLAASLSWAFNGIVAFSFLMLIKNFGTSITFLLFSIISILGLFFVYNIVPETKDTTLEQIENNLRRRVKSRHLGANTN